MDRIQFRRDALAQWSKINPVLLEGEVGFVLDDPNKYKVGDGIHAWNDLPLRGFNGNVANNVGDSEDSVISQKFASSLASTFDVSSSLPAREHKYYSSAWRRVSRDASAGEYDAPSTYQIGDKCNMPDDSTYSYEALEVVTGVPPYTKATDNKYNLSEAIAALPAILRRQGIHVGFIDYNNEFQIWESINSSFTSTAGWQQSDGKHFNKKLSELENKTNNHVFSRNKIINSLIKEIYFENGEIDGKIYYIRYLRVVDNTLSIQIALWDKVNSTYEKIYEGVLHDGYTYLDSIKLHIVIDISNYSGNDFIDYSQYNETLAFNNNCFNISNSPYIKTTIELGKIIPNISTIETKVASVETAVNDVVKKGDKNNLFNGLFTNCYFTGGISSPGQYFENGGAEKVGCVIKIKPNTKYRVTKSSSDRFRIATTEIEPINGENVIRILRQENTQTYISPFDENLICYDFTSEENENYAIFYLSTTGETGIKLQVEENSLTSYIEFTLGNDNIAFPKNIKCKNIHLKNGAIYNGAAGDVESILDDGRVINKYSKAASDDTDALQYLFDNNIMVSLENRNYYISRTLNIDVSKLRCLEGNGAQIIINGYYTAFNVIGNLTASANPSQSGGLAFTEMWAIIRNLKITSSYKERGTGISINKVFGLHIENVSLYYLGSGIKIKGINRNLCFYKNDIYACAGYGIDFTEADVHQININNNHISYCWRCIYINKSDIYNLQIVGNDIETSDTGGIYDGKEVIYIGVNTGNFIECVEIVGNTLEDHNVGNYIIKLVNEDYYNILQNIVITGNSIGNCNKILYVKNANGLIFTSNAVKNFTDYAINTEASIESMIISNNHLRSAGGGLFNTLSKGNLQKINISSNNLIGSCNHNLIKINSYTFNNSIINDNVLNIDATNNYSPDSFPIDVAGNKIYNVIARNNIVNIPNDLTVEKIFNFNTDIKENIIENDNILYKVVE